MTKTEIKDAQKTLDRFTAKYLKGVKPLKVDGVKGRSTNSRILAVKFYLGYGKNRDASYKPLFVRRMRHPHNPAYFPLHMIGLGMARRRRQRKAHSGGLGARALEAAGTMVGQHETGSNNGPWLQAMENYLVHHGHALAWMIPGNPYCGFGVIWSYQHAGVFLPDNFVGTGNICPANGHKGKGYKLVRTSPEKAKPGAIVVFDFNTGHAEHVELARGPAKGGQMPTIGFNTSPGNGGSQSNGGGVYRRWRSTGLMLCVLNVEAAWRPS